MSSAATALVCVLSVLGRSENSLPPIELVDVAPPEVSKYAEAFVGHNAGSIIYLLTSSRVFRDAAEHVRYGCQATPEVKKLASIVAHEEWHVRHGSDERGAYYAQLTTLNSLGVQESNPLYGDVKRTMLTVVRARERSLKRLALLVAAAPE